MRNKLISLLASAGLIALTEGCNLNKYSDLEKAYNNLSNTPIFTSSNPHFHYEMLGKKYKIEKTDSGELGKVIRLDHTYYESDEMEIMCEFGRSENPECKETTDHNYCLDVYIFKKENGEWNYLSKVFISLSPEEALKFFEEFIKESKELKANLEGVLRINNINEDLCIHFHTTKKVPPPEWAKRKQGNLK